MGCGVGLTHGSLSRIGQLHGVDVSASSIDRARAANPDVEYSVADAASLPYDDAAFDVSFAVGLLHHVPVDVRDAVVRELVRVSRRLTVVFEHNPRNPLTRLAVARCEFDDDAIVASCEQRYILFLPWRGSAVRRAEDVLRHVPLGAQYYVAAVR